MGRKGNSLFFGLLWANFESHPQRLRWIDDVARELGRPVVPGFEESLKSEREVSNLATLRLAQRLEDRAIEQFYKSLGASPGKLVGPGSAAKVGSEFLLGFQLVSARAIKQFRYVEVAYVETVKSARALKRTTTRALSNMVEDTVWAAQDLRDNFLSLFERSQKAPTPTVSQIPSLNDSYGSGTRNLIEEKPKGPPNWVKAAVGVAGAIAVGHFAGEPIKNFLGGLGVPLPSFSTVPSSFQDANNLGSPTNDMSQQKEGEAKTVIEISDASGVLNSDIMFMMPTDAQIQEAHGNQNEIRDTTLSASDITSDSNKNFSGQGFYTIADVKLKKGTTLVPILKPDGFQIDYVISHNQNWNSSNLIKNDDVRVFEINELNLNYIEVESSVDQTVQFRVRFYESNERPIKPNLLLATDSVLRVNAQLKEAGFNALSAAIEEYAAGKDSVSAVAISELIANFSFYAEEKEGMPHLISNWFNPFHSLTGFLKGDYFVAECDGGNELSMRFLNLVIDDSGIDTLKAQPIIGWVYKPMENEDKITFATGHRITTLTDMTAFNSYVRLDATPVNRIPKSETDQQDPVADPFRFSGETTTQSAFNEPNSFARNGSDTEGGISEDIPSLTNEEKNEFVKSLNGAKTIPPAAPPSETPDHTNRAILHNRRQGLYLPVWDLQKVAQYARYLDRRAGIIRGEEIVEDTFNVVENPNSVVDAFSALATMQPVLLAAEQVQSIDATTTEGSTGIALLDKESQQEVFGFMNDPIPEVVRQSLWLPVVKQEDDGLEQYTFGFPEIRPIRELQLEFNFFEVPEPVQNSESLIFPKFETQLRLGLIPSTDRFNYKNAKEELATLQLLAVTALASLHSSDLNENVIASNELKRLKLLLVFVNTVLEQLRDGGFSELDYWSKSLYSSSEVIIDFEIESIAVNIVNSESIDHQSKQFLLGIISAVQSKPWPHDLQVAARHAQFYKRRSDSF